MVPHCSQVRKPFLGCKISFVRHFSSTFLARRLLKISSSAVDADVMGIDVAVLDTESDELLGHVCLPMSMVLQSTPHYEEWVSLAAVKKLNSSPSSSLLSLSPPSNGPSPLEARLGQLHLRVSAVAQEEKMKVDAEEKVKEDSRRREREIFKMFAIEDEPYVKEFSCALEKKILHQGRLYVTPHYLMFNAPFAKKVRHSFARSAVSVVLTAFRIFLFRCWPLTTFNH